MLFSTKLADAGFLYTEEGSETASASLVSGTQSKLFSFFAVVFEKQFVILAFVLIRDLH